MSLRVPVSDPSVVVLSAELNKAITVEKLKTAFVKASKQGLKNSLAVSELPLVSVDFKGNPHGAVVDLYSSTLVNDKFVNLLAWYDNEWGYVAQTIKLLEYLAGKI